MNEMEISKPVGIAIAAAVAVLLVGVVGFLAFGRSSGSATPNTVGIPAVASPAVAPPDAATAGGMRPGQVVSTDANGAPEIHDGAAPTGQIPR